MKILVIGAAACVAAATGFAQALDWQDDYRTYSAAMEARQWDKARTAAESAWRGSRKALPDGDTKAYLAQNYVELVYQSDMEAAIEPLKDAVRLGELGYGNDNMPVATLQFLLESAEAWLNQRNRGATNRAFEAFSKVDPADAMLPEVVLARMLVARRLLSHNRPEDAASFAGQLSEDLQNARGARSLIVNAEGIRAVAISNTKPLGENGVATSRARVKDPKVGEFLDRVGEGIRAIRRARAVYPIQQSVTSFDDNLAQLFAYEEFLATFAYSYLGSNDGRKFLDRLGNGKPLIYVPANCPTIQYKPRDGRFPTSEFGYNGVVVYAYDLDDKGRTTNIRVLSEAPGKRFADAVERFVSTWRADVSNVREECRINQLQIHSFYTEAGI